MLDWPYW